MKPVYFPIICATVAFQNKRLTIKLRILIGVSVSKILVSISKYRLV